MKTYEQGLNDAWEAARKISLSNDFDFNTLNKIFSTGSLDYIFNKFSPKTVIEKIKNFEDPLRVGDVVKMKETDTLLLVTHVYENGQFDAIKYKDNYDESIFKFYPRRNYFNGSINECIYEKTGKHFDLYKLLEIKK